MEATEWGHSSGAVHRTLRCGGLRRCCTTKPGTVKTREGSHTHNHTNQPKQHVLPVLGIGLLRVDEQVVRGKRRVQDERQLGAEEVQQDLQRCQESAQQRASK